MIENVSAAFSSVNWVQVLANAFAMMPGILGAVWFLAWKISSLGGRLDQHEAAITILQGDIALVHRVPVIEERVANLAERFTDLRRSLIKE